MKNCLHTKVASNLEGDRWCADCGDPLGPVGTPRFAAGLSAGVENSAHTDKHEELLEHIRDLFKLNALLRTEVFSLSHRINTLIYTVALMLAAMLTGVIMGVVL